MAGESKTPDVSLIYGLIAGLIIILVSLVLYLGGVELYMGPLSFVIYLILITMAVLAALKVRRMNDGGLAFQQALKTTFGVFVIALFLHTLFSYFLLNYIDTGFRDALTRESLKKTAQFMKKMGASDMQLENAMDQAPGKNQFSFGYALLGYAFTCIIAFIFALLISVIVKKNKPVFPTI
jgi:peptidoglycan/LPS O-acetylase OafA/YrhL